MLVHFQKRPWDLFIGVGYTVVMAVVLIAIGTGNPIAVLLILFLPGYVLVAALFPSNKELDWIERVALSFGLSIAVVPLLGLLLNFTPFGIRFVPIVGAVATFTILIGLAAYWRRLKTPAPDRLSATLEIRTPRWGEYSLLDKVLTVGLAASVLAAGVALGYVLTTPRPSERFTELFLLGPGGNASGYPTRLNVSQPGNLVVGVANHESATVNYTVRVDLVGLGIRFNATSRTNETVELNRTTWSWFNFTIGNGESWTQPYGFSINATGLWNVEFLLYRDGDLVTIYHHVHLRVSVT